MGDKIEIKRYKQSWTRYGGADHGLLSRTDEWFCQACNEQQPKSIDSYLFPIGYREVLRICPKCQNLVAKHRILDFHELIRLVRKPEEEYDSILIIAKLKED